MTCLLAGFSVCAQDSSVTKFTFKLTKLEDSIPAVDSGYCSANTYWRGEYKEIFNGMFNEFGWANNQYVTILKDSLIYFHKSATSCESTKLSEIQQEIPLLVNDYQILEDNRGIQYARRWMAVGLLDGGRIHYQLTEENCGLTVIFAFQKAKKKYFYKVINEDGEDKLKISFAHPKIVFETYETRIIVYDKACWVE